MQQKIISIIAIILATGISYRVIDNFFKKIEIPLINPELKGTLLKFLKKIILVLGFVICLGVMGIDLTAIITSLGLTSFAIGFALKDFLSNLFSGILIAWYAPFRLGDHLEVLGREGKVVKIDLRYTVLESEDNTFLIPNSKVFIEVVSLKKQSQ